MTISTMNRVGITLLFVASFLLVALPVSAEELTFGLDEADQTHAEVMAEIEANKAAFAQELAARWEAEALERGNDESWLERISGVLSEEDAETLLSKSEAESWDDFIGIQTTSELVFYPLKPCRIVDTRFATRWGPGTPVLSLRTIAVRTHSSLSGQGGASNCGVSGDAAAVVINVTAVPVSGGQGFLTVWPYGSSKPTASLVNYNSASTSGAIANAVTQSQCYGCSNELYVNASKTTHVIIDVIGYFARNTDTRLQYVNLDSGWYSCPAKSNCTVYSPRCDIAGYTLTGGGPQLKSFTTYVNLVTSRPYGNKWGCQFKNDWSGTRDVKCWAVCAKIPGR